MQEDALHVLVVVRMAVSVIMSFMPMVVRVAVAVMRMSKCSQADDVHEKAEDADDEQFVQTLEFVALPQSLESIEDDLHAHEQEEDTIGESR